MALADFLKNWSRRATTQPSNPAPSQPTQQSIPYNPGGYKDPATGNTIEGSYEYQLDAQGNKLYPVFNQGKLVGYQPDPSRTAADSAYNQYNQTFASLREQLANGQITAEQFRAALGSAGQQRIQTERGGNYQTSNPQMPAAGSLDVYNPGPYIAQLLRSQLPGYVFGTRVPRPNQITMSEFLRMLPVEREQVLPAYVSALGLPPEDFFSEMEKYWLRGTPTRQVSWQT